MSELAAPAAAISAAASPYLTLKHANALFSTTPEALTPEQRQQVSTVVARQREIERRILNSPQAAHVVVNDEAIARSLGEIAARFTSEAEFVLDLARHGLSEQALREDVERDLRVEAVLEMVSARVAPVSNLETELFYQLHYPRFQTPERRSLRHILITINDDTKDNARAAAHARIEQIHALLLKSPDRFAEQALRHSECPTAMQGGLLGQVPRGELFPSLDEAAFQMRPASISGVLESPMGFHILRCDNVQPAGTVPLTAVRDKIRAQMLKTRRENKQRAWVKTLLAR
ncbi:nitrogen fixation protein NifM [Uliginosibacterium sp. 31-16]|uniref:nitrogen fixation protein NifM n=1 Tax=Uliginosibacterium sp. 31-16 TaxID=3068315 RepID=UPI00273F2413|nr:nitrogen fixation protein NifM [Uliginosibacterium sp. 31-16]MDP5241343.1 nitrogen fixation protein NifM [Uliginosibacterium sp. 31-16]